MNKTTYPPKLETKTLQRRSLLAGGLSCALVAMTCQSYAGSLDVEKDELKFGFIKLTDCAPIVIAKEKGFFEDEDLAVKPLHSPIGRHS